MPQIDLNPTLGVDFIGVVLASILYGITTLQTIFYYRTYPKDRAGLKLLVAALWALDTLSLILVAHGVYTYLVIDFANIEDASAIVWSIASEPIVTSVIALTVNLFLIYRIWSLKKKWWPIATFLVIWALGPFAIGIVAVWRTNSGIQSLSAVSELHWMAIAGDSLASSLDITIASILCYLLWQGRTAFTSTNQIIQMLTLYVIMSGMTTALINLATLISYLAAPSALLFQMFNMCVSKAYVNTLMATLNSRQSIRGKPSQSISGLTGSSATANVFPTFRAATRSQAQDGDVDDYALHPHKNSRDAPVVTYSTTLASAGRSNNGGKSSDQSSAHYSDV